MPSTPLGSRMNAPVFQEVLLRINAPGDEQPLATAGVLRHVWKSR